MQQQAELNRPSQTAPLWTRAIVLINALVFVDFGAAFIVKPQGLARLLDIELGSPSALADLRAVYGGLSLAVGIALFIGLRRAASLAPSLVLVIATSAGLAFGRVYSMLASGMPSPVVLGFLATEVASLLWAALAYRALHAGADAPALRVANS